NTTRDSLRRRASGCPGIPPFAILAGVSPAATFRTAYCMLFIGGVLCQVTVQRNLSHAKRGLTDRPKRFSGELVPPSRRLLASRGVSSCTAPGSATRCTLQ